VRFRRFRKEASAPAAPAPSPDEVRAEVDRLAEAGQVDAALDLLVALHRRGQAEGCEEQIRSLRLQAGAVAREQAGRGDWPPRYDDPFPEVRGRFPEVRAGALTTELLGGAVAHHGALIVRGALAPDQVERLAGAIEATHDSKQAEADEASDWYQPLVEIDGAVRRWVAQRGGTWLADSPRSTEIVLSELEAAGIVPAIAGHLGERPVISLQKSTLRRTLPDFGIIAWHQDGSFLGDEVRTMNVWVALSACGGDRPTPGLEILPRRLDGVLPVDGVLSPISVPQELVDELAQEGATIIPTFEAGDALLFDEILLHRTHLAPEMTDVRYALECWFFAPSQATSSYTALLV